MNPRKAVCFLASVLVVFVPLALAMLAPMIANILAYHATMQPSGFPLAIFTTLLWVIVVWRYRTHFTSLFVHKAE